MQVSRKLIEHDDRCEQVARARGIEAFGTGRDARMQRAESFAHARVDVRTAAVPAALADFAEPEFEHVTDPGRLAGCGGHAGRPARRSDSARYSASLAL